MIYYVFEAFLLFTSFFFPSLFLSFYSGGNEFLNSPFLMTIFIVLAFAQLVFMLFILSRDKNILQKDYGLIKLSLKDIFYALFFSLGLYVLYFLIIIFVSVLPKVMQEFMIEGFRWELKNRLMIPLLFLFCMITGYREELLFRSYIITRCSQLSLPIPYVILLSVFSFSILHLYEGIMGFIFSFLSGVYLAFLFVKKKNIHIIAICHGIFNFCALLLSLIEFS